MSTKTTEIEVWAVVDENGDYAVGNSIEQAAERYREDVGGEMADIGIRYVKVTQTSRQRR